MIGKNDGEVKMRHPELVGNLHSMGVQEVLLSGTGEKKGISPAQNTRGRVWEEGDGGGAEEIEAVGKKRKAGMRETLSKSYISSECYIISDRRKQKKDTTTA